MFCAGRPSLFGAMPLLEMNQSWGRHRNGPWGSHPVMGLMHEVLGNGVRFEDLLGRNQPNCVDHSGRRHCRTHCFGHNTPEDLLEQFIIEDTIRDANQISEEANRHHCEKMNSETNESKTSEFGHKENNFDKHVEDVLQSLLSITMKDTHQTNDNDNGHWCENTSSETNESKTNESEDKEKQIDEHKEAVPKSLANDTRAKQSAPWSISVDMKGCDEVRARIEENKIVVEGQTRSIEGFMTVKRVMDLPSHVKGEALTASFGRNGILTLTETQADKEKLVTDIPLSKEDGCTDQSKN